MGKEGRLAEVLLPMVGGILETRENLFQLVQDAGLEAMRVIFQDEAEALAGPKGKHQQERRFHHWGTARSEFPYAGRKIRLDRPRVRSVEGHEAKIPGIEALRERDPLTDRVLEQILLGVSTRGYQSSLPEVPDRVECRGASKSAASRHFVRKTGRELERLLSRPLAELRLPILMIDGVRVAERSLVVALGVDADGRKHVLGLWQGSTENGQLCVELLQSLIERGLRIDPRILIVIDGSKALRKGIEDVLGDAAIVQRCQVHKLRNVMSHLPEKRHAYVTRTMRDAYGAADAKTARAKLRALAAWLERNGEETAARSVKEGLDETLTVLRLGVPEPLRRLLSTTNAIENLIGSFRKTSRNVKRWRNGKMALRWSAAALTAAEKRFRRVKNHRLLPSLLPLLRSHSPDVADQKEVA